MLLYNWQKIFEASGGNPFIVFIILRMLVGREIPKNKHDKLYEFSKLNFSGDSFMLHPDILLYNAYKHEYSDIAQYIALCSLRPLVDYKTTGKIDLDLFTVDIDHELFKHNSLLRFEGDDLHFIYEEVPKEKIH
jgi:hypothetical protein